MYSTVSMSHVILFRTDYFLGAIKNLRNIRFEEIIKDAILEFYECILYKNLTREDCYSIIRNQIGSSDYEFLNWSMVPLENRPDKTLNLFAKYLPTTGDTTRSLAEASFKKEVFFYDTFLSKIKSLGLEEITDFAPNCYFCRSDDVLIFEDLTLMNYRSVNKTEPFSYDLMSLIIKQLAKLHASSLLYEEKISEKRGKSFRIDHKYKQYLNEINLHINETDGTDIPKKMTMETFKEKVQAEYDAFLNVAVKKSGRFRNVLCQGDFWCSNLLFKMEGGTPVDCRILDYQLLRYLPPAHDLLFLIYVNSDKETRTKHMQQLLEEYYTQLSKIMKKYGHDLNEIYTYEEFLDSCEYMKPSAILIASLYLPVVLCPDQKVQDLFRDEKKFEYIFTVDRRELLEDLYHEGSFRQRIRGIVEDIYDICESKLV
ncbi:hypothetical protein NQ317_009599 [Molorchus minor]|uniref:CHK kinase-like domain-containing protein n=1 Tax=Molorchus minor TaxID=1323400 RepID=A0ABQ9IUY0_9CUCU|nr:hypothetical protein NQ317_009599 [Molorchus minor]